MLRYKDDVHIVINIYIYIYIYIRNKPSAYSFRTSKGLLEWQMWLINLHPLKTAGGRLNKKDGLTRYGDSHVKDKTS